MNRTSRLLALCSVPVLACGCLADQPQVAAPEVPAVPVSQPVEREVTDTVDFTGRTYAVQSVDVRARVTGYLIKAPFREGAEVKEGDLLFEIDPRPYEAQLQQAQSQVAVNQASLRLARSTLARDQTIANTATGGISKQQLDQDRAAVDEAEARLKAYEASTEVYKLNLSFTKVRSPITGQVSRYYYTVGNLVNADQTLLTTVVSLDPMYVYFDMDEPTLLRIRRAVNEGKVQRPRNGAIPVTMGLQGETGYPHQGTIDFVNNQLNPTTGSISVRGVFPNPQPEGGERLLSPGMFVRVRLLIGQPYRALLVADRAIGSDQGLKYVYVVDGENKAQYRRITTGALQSDGLRVVSDGLSATDRVVVGGLPQVRPRAEVKPDPVPMPSLARPSGGPEAPPPASPPSERAAPKGNGPRRPGGRS
jgi:multidrug efflux system membrane fusion protein